MLKRLSPEMAVNSLDPRNDVHPIHYAIEDGQGCRVGECWIAWRDESDSPLYTWPLQHTWVLANIWIEPEFRRQGWLRHTWEALRSMYDGIQPEPPLSEQAWQFFASRPEVDMTQMFPMTPRSEYDRCEREPAPADWPG